MNRFFKEVRDTLWAPECETYEDAMRRTERGEVVMLWAIIGTVGSLTALAFVGFYMLGA